MKKVVAGLVVALCASTAMADGGYRGHHHVGHGGGNILIPLVVGGLVGYGVSRAQQPQVIVQQQPVYVQPQPIYALPPQQVCELRSEVVNGQIIQGNFCYYR